jgi:hypothetical protein
MDEMHGNTIRLNIHAYCQIFFAHFPRKIQFKFICSSIKTVFGLNGDRFTAAASLTMGNFGQSLHLFEAHFDLANSNEKSQKFHCFLVLSTRKN